MFEDVHVLDSGYLHQVVRYLRPNIDSDLIPSTVSMSSFVMHNFLEYIENLSKELSESQGQVSFTAGYKTEKGSFSIPVNVSMSMRC